jgi:hypothetical protein
MSKTPDLEKAVLAAAQHHDGERHDVDSTNISRPPSIKNEKQEEEEEEIQRIPTHRTSGSTRPKSTLVALAKTLTTRSNASLIDLDPPPDGGIKAWSQALMGHLVIFNTWGMIASFGVFQEYYTSQLGLQPSAVSWIGSVQMFGHFSLGMFTGRMLDAGG